MRLEFGGGINQPEPLTLVFRTSNTFDTSDYIDLGYSHYDITCIGAGGGRGASIDNGRVDVVPIRAYGGAGGGGGYHRVRGLLSSLPDSCAIVVGEKGSEGTWEESDGEGEAGGYSSFNSTTCRASGGLGGKGFEEDLGISSPSTADGGAGGIGNSITAGGGGAGGEAGTSSPTPTSSNVGTPGENGLLNENVGKGGGGGAGGVGVYEEYAESTSDFASLKASAGGSGSYGDSSVSSPGGFPSDDFELDPGVTIVPGVAGGARVSYLGAADFGKSGEDGIVVIRLTSE